MFLIKHIWLVNFVPLLIGSLYYRKFDKSLKVFFLFVVFGTLTEVASKVGIYFFDIKNTMPVGHIYIAGACLFTGLFYLYELGTFIKKGITIGLIVFVESIVILNFLFLQSPHSFPSISGAFVATLLVTFSVLLFSKIMVEGKIKKLHEEPVVWLNSAILINYSSNFFFYILYNVILGFSREFSIRTISFFTLINGIFYILIAIGFSKAKKKKKQ
ncbi:hypothetical protein SAMN05444274_102235 [Mariniphaga anaerophila]|uniref:YhhN-like protein n=1 Tax=Mariniphaga anaerophila TaxID=1484053 RepID=A0A1M4VWH0_9BACT|nr:hypothetical protein [Mariniphaga anaerophila]SHE73318.1 hypothetical protein SAMN05444274_102235 [Mariniphaga anaerophila]